MIFRWYCGAVMLIGAISAASAASYTFSSIGSEHANVDGTGASARFGDPHGIAVNRNGNVFVADKETIRKITPAGVVTTFAGSPGQAGHDDGVGSAARFTALVGLTIDSSDNLYAISGYAVRKITPAGLVSTFAGNGAESGLADGPDATARFSAMGGIAVDSGGNVYVSITWRGQIWKITPQGLVSWLAGVEGSGDVDGPTVLATFGQPRGLAVDASGNLYVATATRVRKITPIGDVSSLAGGDSFDYAEGTGAAARFAFPDGITVDSTGTVYVADYSNGLIRKVTASGVVTTFAGQYPLRGYTDGPGSAASFILPTGIALDANGKLYVTDIGAKRGARLYR